MPYSVEMNDVPIFSTAFEGEQFVAMVRRQFDRLYLEGATSGATMCLAVHPAVIGQAQRAKYLDEALTYMKSFPDVWFATGREIADHYMTHCYDAVIDRLATWEQVP
jgi:allantoinase